ncbi:TIGR04283 family arsenosugar biosynthesis glycosyltransferase [Ferrovum sp. PN-J185]|uniref:TIGR04283 family arsenosugar biosynthesis glycosyltransferase n=1 Tax=Ferrovum sp. PN-J185 TaxID=1356306 RepID=UPI000796F526|nr:TIGR04283 family arsenosugar biosynthesis glycosyltransferase [Ferrovum sp. PN-J185]KXW56951.1 N-glycosyltransferase [Ferrovum sp. PN-J185]
MKSEILIIIPILNESTQINDLINHLLWIKKFNLDVIVVDGGSTDGCTKKIIDSKIPLISSSKGRSIQMNAGVTLECYKLLIFLHADTRLTEHAVMDLLKLNVKEDSWGRFDVEIIGSYSFFKIISFFINLRSRLSGIATGDQTIFISYKLFRRIGGFPEQPLMEDIEISRCLKSISKPICFTSKVLTSGRRWEDYGIIKTILLMWYLRFLYWIGVNPVYLKSLYK